MEHLVEIIEDNHNEIFRKDNTYITFVKCNMTPLRWGSDNGLFFAGSAEDALFDLDEDIFITLPVSQCSAEIQTEYEKRIIECIENGEIEL
jgi:hypothetical protein